VPPPPRNPWSPVPPRSGRMQVRRAPESPSRHWAPVRTVVLQVQSFEQAVICALQPPWMHDQQAAPALPMVPDDASSGGSKVARLASGLGTHTPESCVASWVDPASAGEPVLDDEHAARPATAARRPTAAYVDAPPRFTGPFALLTLATPGIE
jgi:hypothetical protein